MFLLSSQDLSWRGGSFRRELSALVAGECWLSHVCGRVTEGVIKSDGMTSTTLLKRELEVGEDRGRIRLPGHFG